MTNLPQCADGDGVVVLIATYASEVAADAESSMAIRDARSAEQSNSIAIEPARRGLR